MNHDSTDGEHEQTLAELVQTSSSTWLAGSAATSLLGALLSRTPSELSQKETAHAVARGLYLPPLVRRLLDHVCANPLASAGWFIGDVLRCLMEIPPWFWRREPELYDRYRDVVRAAAAARRYLPAEKRLEFWNPLPD
jgi:hypothetical protein